MARQQENNWQGYIERLADFPPFSSQWEHDFAKIVTSTIDVDAGIDILEIGCSNGRWLRWFAQEYSCQVWGVDMALEGLKSDPGSGINFAVGDALNIPYQDASFDIVFSLGLIEHFSHQEKFQILKEQVRVLKDRGYLICQVPLLSIFSLNYYYVKYAYDWREGTSHLITTTYEVEAFFRKLGLELEFTGLTGCLFDFARHRQLHQKALLKRFLATEILIIGKKSVVLANDAGDVSLESLD